MQNIRTADVLIDQSEDDDLSAACPDLETLGKLVAVITDAAWDTQDMTFEGTVDGVTFFPIYDEGTLYTIAGVVASSYNKVDPTVFFGCTAIKVASAVGQGDDTTITMIFWQTE